MKDTLTLDNFKDIIAPTILDSGAVISLSKRLQNIEHDGENTWVATFHDTGKPIELAVELNKKNAITVLECECGKMELDDLERPCEHVVALLLEIHGQQDKKREVLKTRKSPPKVKTKPNKPKDPAEALLGELQPKEIYDFLRLMVTKHKDFKSLFLLHFSEKDHGNDQKYNDIVINTINSVKGRKKYLKGIDGAKISSKLTPLYKQSALAESKGLFREAYLICKSLLEQLPDVFIALDTNSVKLDGLLNNTFLVMDLVIQNPSTPFDLKDEIFTFLSDTYISQERKHSNSILEQYFQTAFLTAKTIQKLPELAEKIINQIDEYDKLQNISRWSTEYYKKLKLINRLAHITEHETSDWKKLENILLKNKHIFDCYKKLIELSFKKEDYNATRAYLSDMQANIQQYLKSDFEKKVENYLVIQNLLLAAKTGNAEETAKIAAKMFNNSNFLEFDYFEIEKISLEASDWKNRVEYYLSKTQKNLTLLTYGINPHLEILTREKRWLQLVQKMSEIKNLEIWIKYGSHLIRHRPTDYLSIMPRIIEKDLSIIHSNNSVTIVKAMLAMAQLEGGKEVVSELKNRLIQYYSYKKGLVSELKLIHI